MDPALSTSSYKASTVRLQCDCLWRFCTSSDNGPRERAPFLAGRGKEARITGERGNKRPARLRPRPTIHDPRVAVWSRGEDASVLRCYLSDVCRDRDKCDRSQTARVTTVEVRWALTGHLVSASLWREPGVATGSQLGSQLGSAHAWGACGRAEKPMPPPLAEAFLLVLGPSRTCGAAASPSEWTTAPRPGGEMGQMAAGVRKPCVAPSPPGA